MQTILDIGIYIILVQKLVHEKTAFLIYLFIKSFVLLKKTENSGTQTSFKNFRNNNSALIAKLPGAGSSNVVSLADGFGDYTVNVEDGILAFEVTKERKIFSNPVLGNFVKMGNNSGQQIVYTLPTLHLWQ